MRKFIWIPVLIIIAFIIGRLFYYGVSSYAAPALPVLPQADLTVAARSQRLEAVDNPAVSQGVVAIDYAHSNALYIEELNILLSKLVNRGYSYELITAPAETDPLAVDISSTTTNDLIDKLRYAKALILPLPRFEYTPEEIAAIRQFVEKGGRVFIIGDPTRTVVVEPLNSIAGAFGIIFANDYLYSQVNNDNNYRNVVYSNFNESQVTQGLDQDNKVILYAAGSINAPGHEIIMGDDTTYSSVSEGGRKMAAAALTTADRVLAVGDLTFFGEPYSAAESNGTFINNIADFLAGGQREFELADFPYFLNQKIDLVYDDSLVLNSQLDNSVKLKQLLEEQSRAVTFTDKIGQANDVVFVSRFDKAEPVKEYLAKGGITILDLEQKPADTNQQITPVDDSFSDTSTVQEEEFVTGRIQIEGVGELERGGATLFYRYKEGDRNIVIILSDTAQTNADAFSLLFDNQLNDCRISEVIAVCQTQTPGGGLPPSLRRHRIDKILVVASDSGRTHDDQLTGLPEFTEALKKSYKVDNWVISEKGQSPDVDELLEYDAVIWATGDYWDDSISTEDAALLSKYIELGGNLLLSGASIAFDWDHTDFLTKVAHVDYLTFAPQYDLALALPDHPIAADFDEGEVITFTASPSGVDLNIDVINHTPNARAIFLRGSESKQPGAPAVIAYEDDRSKVAYFAFPIYLLPKEARNRLIDNTIEWFTRKPLPLPDESDFTPFVPLPDDLEGDEEVPPEGEEVPPENGKGDQNGNDNGQDNTGGNNQQQ